MKFVLLALLMIPVTADSAQCNKQTRLAVVDTGLDLNDPRFKGHLCPTGHKSFVDGESLTDPDGHGTHVSGLIVRYADKANYCLLIYKYFQKDAIGIVGAKREVLAFKEAIANGATVINFSAGGSAFDEDEYLLIKNHPEVTFVVAAGNEGRDLDIPGNEYYPASYFLSNMFVIGNIDSNQNRAKSSNYGKNILYENGTNVLSTYPCDSPDKGYSCYAYMSGTSMSAATFSGKLLAKTPNSCQYGNHQ